MIYPNVYGLFMVLEVFYMNYRQHSIMPTWWRFSATRGWIVDPDHKRDWKVECV